MKFTRFLWMGWLTALLMPFVSAGAAPASDGASSLPVDASSPPAIVPAASAPPIRLAQATTGKKSPGKTTTQDPNYTLSVISNFLAASEFCGAPYRTLCESSTYNPRGRQLRVQALREKLRKKALEDTAKAIKRDPRTFTEAEINALQPESHRQQVIDYYTKRIGQWYDFEVGLAEFMGVWGNITRVKGYLKQAIDARLAPAGPSGQALAAELKLAIDLTIPMDRKGLQAALDQRHPDAPYLAQAFQQACGPDGLTDNAFAYRPREIRYLIVCPGLLMGAPSGGDFQTADFRNLLQALAHELGHHIDSGVYPGLFANLQTCLATYEADGLIIPGSSAAPGTEMQRVQAHMREITADYWANQAIAIYLQTDGRGLPGIDKNQVLRETFGALCGSPGDGVHPSGRYRIEVLLRGDPSLSSQMGCQGNLGSRPACGLSGAVK